MRGRNKTPLLGWHPPAELLARVEAEVERRGGGRGVKSEVLSEAVTKGLDAISTATSHKRNREDSEMSARDTTGTKIRPAQVIDPDSPGNPTWQLAGRPSRMNCHDEAVSSPLNSGAFGCVLVAEHEGDHENREGIKWER